MEIDVVVHNIECNKHRIKATACAILDLLNLPDAELSIVLCDDAFIHPINRDYRNKDKPTDVLSFSQREGEFAFHNDNILGDVIISIETAKRQALERKHNLERETNILLIHGILHLIGYDHIEEAQALKMEGLEIEILSAIGFNNPYQEIMD